MSGQNPFGVSMGHAAQLTPRTVHIWIPDAHASDAYAPNKPARAMGYYTQYPVTQDAFEPPTDTATAQP